MDRGKDGRMEGWTDGLIDGWTDGPMDGRTEKYTCCDGLEEILFPLSLKSFSSPSKLGRCMVHSAIIWLVIHVNNTLFSTNFLIESKFTSHT